MELLSFLFWLFLCAGLVLAIRYYFQLFSDGRPQYQRNELLQVHEFIIKEASEVLGSDALSGGLGLTVGLLLGLAFSYMGGIFGKHYESYLFQSALLPLLWYLGFPQLKETFSAEVAQGSFLGKLVDNDVASLFGFSVAIMAQNFSIYFLFHGVSFLWIILNNLAIIGLLMYRFYQRQTEPQFEPAEDVGPPDTALEDE